MDSELTPQTPQGSASAFGNKGRILSIIILVIVVVAVGIGYWYWQKESLINSVEKSISTGDLESAITETTSALTHDPNNSELLALKSRALSEQAVQTYNLTQRNTQIAQALQTAQDATKSGANNSDAWTALGLASEIGQQYKPAHTAFQHALSLNPKNAVAEFGDGETYFFEGDMNHAQQTYQKSLTLDANLARAQAGLGRIAFDRGDLASATAEFKKAYDGEANPHLRAEDAYYLGMIAMKNNDLANAKTYLDQATTIDTNNALGWYGLGTWEFAILTSTSTAVRNQFGTESPIVLLSKSFADLGKAAQINPDLTLAKVQTAYQIGTITQPSAAIQALTAASISLTKDIVLNPEERTSLEDRITALEKTFSAPKSTKK